VSCSLRVPVAGQRYVLCWLIDLGALLRARLRSSSRTSGGPRLPDRVGCCLYASGTRSSPNPRRMCINPFGLPTWREAFCQLIERGISLKKMLEPDYARTFVLLVLAATQKLPVPVIPRDVQDRTLVTEYVRTNECCCLFHRRPHSSSVLGPLLRLQSRHEGARLSGSERPCRASDQSGPLALCKIGHPPSSDSGRSGPILRTPQLPRCVESLCAHLAA
jgi:hypothetical protein